MERAWRASLTFRTLACVGSGELWRLVFAF
jgi:hypothetical protein